MVTWLDDLFTQQSGDLPIEIWMEPFAGGAGAALTLLDRDAVAEAWLVDANHGIAAFWLAVLEAGEAFAHRVENTTPTLELFDESRHILANAGNGAAQDPFDLGFAAFIVNRCSRSGIVTATSGPIGGRNQSGRWLIDARYNPASLADRIRHVHTMRSRLRIEQGDGISRLGELTDSGIEDELMAFVDPPYIREGNRLYANGMSESDHERLASVLNTGAFRWVLTYDDEPIVSDTLYPDSRVLGYEIRNTANRARVAREFAMFSDNIDLRGLSAPLEGRSAIWVRNDAERTNQFN